MRLRSAGLMATMLRVLIAAIILQQYWTCKSCVFFMGFHMTPGSRPWTSCNGFFSFGFLPASYSYKYYLAIWGEMSPGVRNIIWVANSGSKVAMVGKNATLRFEVSGNLRLTDGDGTTVWQTNTSDSGAAFGKLSDWGNLVLYANWDVTPWPWESLGHPTVSLQFTQHLTEKEALATVPNALGNYYRLAFVRSGSTLHLALTYVRPKATNFTYWRGPALKRCSGGSASAFLTTGGSFVMACEGAAGNVTYIFQPRVDDESPSQIGGETRQLELQDDGRLVLSRFDTSSQKWVREWATGSTACAAAGVCGNGICNLHADAGRMKRHCSCPPGYSMADSGDCRRNVTAEAGCLAGGLGYVMEKIEKTNYFVGGSAIAKFGNLTTGKECGERCNADCLCVASVYAPAGKAFVCWTLRALELGGFPYPSAELYVKVNRTGHTHPHRRQTDSGHSHDREKNDPITWLWVVPVTLSMLMPLALPLYLVLNQRTPRIEGKDEEGERSLTTVPGMPVSFSHAELREATCGFSEPIARGGFSYVYKGRFADGTVVAVKQLDEQLSQVDGQRNFEAEVFTIGAMNHANLVRLHGFCSEAEHRLLVYEYLENGSLDKWLFAREDDKAKRLCWKTRFEIAISTAKGIAYCHEQCRNCIIHCDIKPGNVLLDCSFRAKVSDFGLAKLVAGGEQPAASVRGTRGYLAPEWWKHKPITVKVDVYSFGMLLLDLIGGRRTRNLSSDSDDFYYPIWAYEQMKNGTPEATLDPRLEGNVDPDELMRCLLVAFWCLQDNANTRPTMGNVVKMLEGVVPIATPEVPRSFLYLMIADGEFSTNIHELNHPTTATLTISTIEGR